MATNQEIGNLGEDIAVKHLVKLNHIILDRNFRKPWGEIDIVSKKDSTIHFIEVKSVSHETPVFQATFSDKDGYIPEDNVHDWKLKRLNKAIQSYLGEKNITEEQDWQIDIMAVFLDLKQKKAKIRITEDV